MAAEEEAPAAAAFSMIAGMINTKDQSGYFRPFQGMVRHVYTVPIFSSDAGVANDELAVRASEADLSAEPVSSIMCALKLLRDTWDEGEPPPRILIGGSLYQAGEALKLNGTPQLRAHHVSCGCRRSLLCCPIGRGPLREARDTYTELALR